MSVARLAWLSFIRRGWGLLYLVAPTTALFALVALFVATESSISWTHVDEWDRCVFRLGSMNPQNFFSRGELERIRRLPMIESLGMQVNANCQTEETNHEPSSCNATSSAYLRIWRSQLLVTDEQLEQWEAVKSGAIVATATARRFNWHVGQTIYMKRTYSAKDKPPAAMIITAIVDNQMGNFEPVYIHPDYGDQINDQPLKFWSVWIKVNQSVNREAAIRAVVNEFPGRSVMIWKMEDVKAMLIGGADVITTAIRGAGILAIFLVVVVSLTFISLSIDERRRELATLRAIGYRRSHVIRMILAESLLLISPGVILGCLIPFLLFRYGLQVVAFNILLTWRVSLMTALSGILLGGMVALVPAARAAVADPLTSLRGA